ncbi:AAA family ATPase [Bacillus anthracis]|uniref:AAA family ATPase n=1 Tax=Bacillus cereus group TaxID=86661 RepID=UPI003D1F42E2
MSSIFIKKLIVQGTSYKRTIRFNEGLTIISGEKTSGKSLILSLIDYCLGKSEKIDLKVQKELNIHCDQIFIELKINDEIFTFSRLLKKKQSNISIYFCAFEDIEGYTPKSVTISEAMHFLMTKLNINEYKIIKHQKHSTKKELQIVSFRDIFRYVYINQHALGTKDFLENKTTFKRNKNPHAFKLIFGLVESDKDALKEKLVDTQNKIEDAYKVIAGLNLYLKDKDAEDFNVLSAKYNRIKKDIEKQKKEKKTIIESSKLNNNSENELYIKLKKDLEEIANQIVEYQRNKRQLLMSINSKKLLVEEYRVEEKEVDATLEINYTLVIPDQNIECPLCNSTVLIHEKEEVNQSTNTEKMLRKVKKEITDKINLVKNLINDDMKSIEGIDVQIERLSRKQDILNEAIVEFVKETDVPFLSQIDSINSLLNRLIKDHEIVKEGIRIHRKIDEKQKDITNLETTATRLEGEIAALKISDKDRETIFDFLNTEYQNFMTRLKYDTNGETFIHPEQYIPYYEGASVYAHESGGLLECMQLSYLGAILNSKSEGYASGHPGLLLLDSISKYVGTLKKSEKKEEQDGNQQQNLVQKSAEDQTKIEEKNLINDPEVYEEFYKILIELSTYHQIILVENTPPEKFNKYIKYVFLKGKKGLINPEKNEFTEGDEGL